eukprot:179169-Pelagomonas_calceolata.AAC.2
MAPRTVKTRSSASGSPSVLTDRVGPQPRCCCLAGPRKMGRKGRATLLLLGESAQEVRGEGMLKNSKDARVRLVSGQAGQGHSHAATACGSSQDGEEGGLVNIEHCYCWSSCLTSCLRPAT